MRLDTPFLARDALAAGLVTPAQLRGPRFRRLFRGIRVHAHVPVDLALLARAAALLHPDAVVGGWAAAELLGASCGPLDAPVELIVPGRTRGRPGLVVRRDTLGRGEVTTRSGVRVTTHLRTAFDLARTCDPLYAVIALDALARTGRFPLRDVVRLGYLHPNARGATRLPGLVAQADPRSGSPMETRIRLAIVGGGLPCPDLQVPVGRYVLDHAYRKAKLGIEHDGAHHRTAEQALYDLERQAFFSEAGWRILRYRPAVVLGRPQEIPLEVAAELRRRT